MSEHEPIERILRERPKARDIEDYEPPLACEPENRPYPLPPHAPQPHEAPPKPRAEPEED